MSKWTYEGHQVNACPVDGMGLERVERLRAAGRRGSFCVEGWPAILDQADGDDRSGVDTSNEPAYVYDGDDLDEARRAAREWLAGQPVEVFGGRGPERVAYAAADIEWVEDPDGDDYEGTGEIVSLAQYDNLPTELDVAWHRMLDGYRRYLDYQDDGYDGLYVELAAIGREDD